ncbi:MAG: hypothetical protein K0R39_192 [Symbiobacteriaceae bacterium]|jgi:hypothetical protein|nr:hypothetical protein [Symbiobacteriaceae bacterium]
MWFQVKQTAALLLAAVNGCLLVWAILTYRRRGAMPDSYYRLLMVSPAAAAVLVAMGLAFLAQGYIAPGMHIFYGSVVGAGGLAQLALGRRRSALGHKYRARPLVHLVLALFVGLLGARAWMAA